MSDQQTTNPYGLEEGLAPADDIDSSVIGEAEVSRSESVQTWPEYGLELVPINLNDEDTGRRLLLRNGEFIADVSEKYHILPNERAVEAGEAVARDLGAVPFEEFDGDWYVPLHDHVFQDHERRRVHALWAWDDPVDIGDGDDIQFGFSIHNSIDKSLAFQVSLWTFRHACANMVFMGHEGRGMGFDDRDVIVHDSRAHTKNLDVEIEPLKATVKNILLMSEDVTETYRRWHEQLIEPEEVLGLLDRFPAKDLPGWIRDAGTEIESERAAAEATDEGFSPQRRAEIAEAHIPTAKTTWEVYNDLTESIWHDEDTGDRTKKRKMKDVHRVMPPTDGLR